MKRIDEIFAEALERPAAERDTFLDQACADAGVDPQRVRTLLRAHEQAGAFLEVEPDAVTDRWLGRRVGPFELTELLGRGGSGRVYAARRVEGDFDQRVAVKLLRRTLDATEGTRRFRIECEALSRLTHPNIARILDAGLADDGRAFLIMELVEGSPIHDWCDTERLGVEARLRLFRDVCAAVEYAHSSLVVHRDLKPSNILVDDAGVVKLLDFGIAKLLDGDVPGAETMTTQRRLTPRYASPEQLEGQPVSTRSDVYSLGVVLYEILTGRSPYSLEGIESRDWSKAIQKVEVARPSDAVDETRSGLRGETTPRLRRRLRGDLDRILAKAMHRDPERRYPSPAHLADDLDRYLQRKPVLARPDTVRYRVSKFIRRNPVGVGLASVAALALLTATVISSVSLLNLRRAQRETEVQRNAAQQTVAFLQSMISSVDPEETQSSEEVTVRQLLDAARPRIDEELADQPRVAAQMLGTLSETYRSLGQYEAADEALVASLQRLRAVLPPGDPAIGHTLFARGQVASDLGEFQRAREILEESLQILASSPESDRIEAESLLADVLAQQGQYDEAIARGNQVVEAARRVGTDAQLLVALNSTGLSLVRSGRPSEAPAYFEEAIEVASRLHGPSHSKTGQTMNNLGFALKQAGREAEAVEPLRGALAIYEEVFEPGSLRIAAARSNLGDALGRTGEHAEAERLHRAAVAAFRDQLGPDHPNTGHTTNSLGVLYMTKGDYARGIEAFREAARIYGIVFGERHRNTAAALYNLARCQRRDGRLDESLRTNQLALSIREEQLDPDHPDIARSTDLMGRVFLDLGDPATAKQWLARAMSLRRKLYDPANPMRTDTERAFASSCVELGQYEEAETVLGFTLQALVEELGAEHDRTLACAEDLEELARARSSRGGD